MPPAYNTASTALECIGDAAYRCVDGFAPIDGQLGCAVVYTVQANLGACVAGVGFADPNAAVAALSDADRAAALNTYLSTAQQQNAGITDADVSLAGVVATSGCNNQRRRLAVGGAPVTLTFTFEVKTDAAKAQALNTIGNSDPSTFDSTGLTLLGQPFAVTGSDAVLTPPAGAENHREISFLHSHNSAILCLFSSFTRHHAVVVL